MIRQLLKAIAGTAVVVSLVASSVQPATSVRATAMHAPAAAHGPIGTPKVQLPGKTFLLVVVDSSTIKPGALTAASRMSLATAYNNYNNNGDTVSVPVLVLGGNATPTVRDALTQIQSYSPVEIALLGMNDGQRLTIIANVVASGIAVYVDKQPGPITTAKKLRAAVDNTDYYVPVSIQRTAGLRPATQIPDDLKLTAPDVDTPPSVNLSDGLPPVGDQGSESSCVGWSTSYYYKTWQEGQEHHWDVNKPEHQFSPAFVYNEVNGGKDQGARFYDAMTLITEKGDVPLSVFPYLDGKFTLRPNKSIIASADPYRAKSFGYLISHDASENPPYDDDIQPLKQMLADGQPFVIGLEMFQSFEDYDGGVYDGPYDSDGKNPIDGHAMMVVGYDDNAEGTDIGAFLLVNSWSTDWGEDGFAWVSYDYLSQYTDDAWAMVDDTNDPQPVSVKPYPNPGADDSTDTAIAYTTDATFKLKKNPAKHDFIATVSFDYQSTQGDTVLEDHTYRVNVEVPADFDVTVTQDYRMDDGAIVTGQEIVTTPTY